MSGHRAFQILTLLVAIALIAGAGWFQDGIADIRRQADLASGVEETGDYAELRLLQATPGIIRALVIDYLWIRSESLKSKGQYHDAEQSTSMICKLQPRFPAVWVNRAWNLSYNISVKYNTPRDRWHWVTRGIHLLRDEGIKYNPKALELYKELSWIYMHKIGQNLDDMHWTYKERHAAEFHRIVGAPPPLGRTDLIERYTRWFRPIVDAPDTRAELLADEQVAAFVQQLDDLDVQLGLGVLDAYTVWSDDPLVRVQGHPGYKPGNETQEKLKEIMGDPATGDARAKVVAYSRKRVLTQTYRMKPWWMLRMVSKYGPLDWRSTWSHSLYWSSYGLYNCKGLDLDHMDPINTGRIVLNSLKSLVSYGQVSLLYNPQNPSVPRLDQRFEWRFIDVCQDTFLTMNEFYAGQDDDRTFGKFRASHENWLRYAVQMFYLSGETDRADEYLDYLKRSFGHRDRKLYGLDLEQFVYQSLNRQGLTQRQSVSGFVSAMVSRAYKDIQMGEDVDFDHRLDQARYFWTAWNELVQGDTRKTLEDFNSIQAYAALDTLMISPLAEAMSIWEYVPHPAQQAAYDMVDGAFRPLCEKRSIDFDKAFPEPTGMAEFRAWQQQRQMQHAAPGESAGKPWRSQMGSQPPIEQ